MNTDTLVISTEKNQTVVTDRMDHDLLDYCLELNVNPIELRTQGQYKVYALFSGLNKEEAGERLQALIRRGFTDVWIESEVQMEVAC